MSGGTIVEIIKEGEIGFLFPGGWVGVFPELPQLPEKKKNDPKNEIF